MLLATLSYVTCDVIPFVCPLIDHGSRMKALEFLTLLLYMIYITSLMSARSQRLLRMTADDSAANECEMHNTEEMHISYAKSAFFRKL
jgi:hypothetical protein